MTAAPSLAVAPVPTLILHHPSAAGSILHRPTNSTIFYEIHKAINLARDARPF